ncbi:hypothetical protein GGR58DRAFT_485956 [Xylaria digitata]|nr:hypothetical protein GGR58DRAFT_485956 [Xylaria digitata]
MFITILYSGHDSTSASSKRKGKSPKIRIAKCARTQSLAMPNRTLYEIKKRSLVNFTGVINRILPTRNILVRGDTAEIHRGGCCREFEELRDGENHICYTSRLYRLRTFQYKASGCKPNKTMVVIANPVTAAQVEAAFLDKPSAMCDTLEVINGGPSLMTMHGDTWKK